MNIWFKMISPEEELDEYLPVIHDRLEETLQIGGDLYDVEDVVEELRAKHWQLVIGMDDSGTVLGEAVYQKVIYPKKKSLVLRMVSAKCFHDFWRPVYAYSFDLKDSLRFDIIEIYCRPAVARLLREKKHTANYWMIANERR